MASAASPLCSPPTSGCRSACTERRSASSWPASSGDLAARDRHELMVIGRLRPGDRPRSRRCPSSKPSPRASRPSIPTSIATTPFVLGPQSRFTLSHAPRKRHRVHGGVGGDDGDGRDRAAGRLPQPRQHVPGARRRASHRDRDPPVARRRPRAHPAPAPHRGLPGLARRRRRRARARRLGGALGGGLDRPGAAVRQLRARRRARRRG